MGISADQGRDPVALGRPSIAPVSGPLRNDENRVCACSERPPRVPAGRGHGAHDADCLRRAGLPPLRVEMRLPEHRLSAGGAAPRVRLRGHLPSGGHRQGRNRDTAWFSITDAEWPRLAAAYARWLAPANFDAEGRQRIALSKLTLPDALSAP